MAMLADTLMDGSLGLRVALPDGVRFDRHTATLIDFTDAQAVRWMILFERVALDLGAETRDLRAKDVDKNARVILRYVETTLPPTAGPREGRRVDDPAWTPVIENEVVAVGGATALKVLHRTMYQPGREMVMGHLVLPARGGVVEIRTIAMDRTTGFRESVLMSVMPRTEAPLAVPPQSYFDDPTHDARFPEHCLSRTRAVFSRLLAPGVIECSERHAERALSATVDLGDGLSMRPPPRFVTAPPLPGAVFHGVRMTFAVSDGRWSLYVMTTEVDESLRDPSSLRRAAQAMLSRVCGDQVVRGASIAVRPRDDGALLARCDIAESSKEGAIATVWWAASERTMYGIVVSGSVNVPLEDARGFLDEALASVNPPPASLAARPWWRLW